MAESSFPISKDAHICKVAVEELAPKVKERKVHALSTKTHICSTTPHGVIILLILRENKTFDF